MRAIIIERWTILRYGVRAVLGQAGHPVLSAASSATEGLAAVRGAHQVQLVIAGVVDDAEPVELVRQLAAAVPDAKILVLVDQLELEHVEGLLGAGADGILDRIAEGDEVLDAIDRIERGERVLSNDVISIVLGGIDPARGDHDDSDAACPLTARELEILRCLVTGASNREIAQKLFIGESTVKTHLASTYAKLGVSNRHQAVARGIELGLVSWGSSVMGRTT